MVPNWKIDVVVVDVNSHMINGRIGNDYKPLLWKITGTQCERSIWIYQKKIENMIRWLSALHHIVVGVKVEYR
jgi:hypothetical protein